MKAQHIYLIITTIITIPVIFIISQIWNGKNEVTTSCNQYYQAEGVCFPMSCFDAKCYYGQRDLVVIKILSKSMLNKNLNEFRNGMNVKVDRIQKTKKQQLIDNGPDYVETSLGKLVNEFNKRISKMQQDIFDDIRNQNVEAYQNFWDQAKKSDHCRYRDYYEGISFVVSEILGDEFDKYKLVQSFNEDLLKQFEDFLKSGKYNFTRHQWWKYHYYIETRLCDLGS